MDSYISMSDAEVLKYAIDNGMIDPTLVQEMIEMQKREEFLAMHNYDIWKGTNGKWYTYLPDEEKGRILKKRADKKSIEDLIVDYYRKRKEVHTLESVFYEWINEKLEFGEVQKQTYDRYLTDFHRFFDGHNLLKKDIRFITEDELEYFVKSSIKSKELTNKAYAGMRTIIMGIFRFAKKRKYVSMSITNFFGDIDISRKTFKKKIVKDEEAVFTDAEVLRITQFILNDPTLINLGILLAFQTGIRVGELAALQMSDVQGNLLHVYKTEVRYRDENNKYVFEVRECAKTDAGNRNVILVSDALQTIKMIKRLNPFGEYMFMKNGLRIKEKAFSVKLTKICRYVGIRERSMHKARKTYATKLLNGHVDERIVTKQLGHTDISCTKNFYYFNNKDQEEARAQIEHAILGQR